MLQDWSSKRLRVKPFVFGDGLFPIGPMACKSDRSPIETSVDSEFRLPIRFNLVVFDFENFGLIDQPAQILLSSRGCGILLGHNSEVIACQRELARFDFDQCKIVQRLKMIGRSIENFLNEFPQSSDRSLQLRNATAPDKNRARISWWCDCCLSSMLSRPLSFGLHESRRRFDQSIEIQIRFRRRSGLIGRHRCVWDRQRIGCNARLRLGSPVQEARARFWSAQSSQQTRMLSAAENFLQLLFVTIRTSRLFRYSPENYRKVRHLLALVHRNRGTNPSERPSQRVRPRTGGRKRIASIGRSAQQEAAYLFPETPPRSSMALVVKLLRRPGACLGRHSRRWLRTRREILGSGGGRLADRGPSCRPVAIQSSLARKIILNIWSMRVTLL